MILIFYSFFPFINLIHNYHFLLLLIEKYKNSVKSSLDELQNCVSIDTNPTEWETNSIEAKEYEMHNNINLIINNFGIYNIRFM